MIKDLLVRIPFFKIFRAWGRPKLSPLNLTINSTYYCVSRCQTCNVWKKRVKELSLSEWDKIFKSVGKGLYWLIVSGGEPFLRKDLVQLCRLAYKHCRPKVINIPTNGFLDEIIPDRIERILKACPRSELVVNFSLDALGDRHDEIRNLPGSFERMLKSYKAVRKIKNSRLAVGVHTVISKLNCHQLPKIYNFVVKELRPDSFITEIAERRVELDTLGLELVPNQEEYARAINFLLKKMQAKKFHGFSRVTHALRINYYDLVKKVLRTKKQALPCYAGFASAQISADGKVWPCCVRGDEMGDLRRSGYDFRKVWRSAAAEKIRQSIKKGECHCPLASACYTSMLMNTKTLAKIFFELVKP